MSTDEIFTYRIYCNTEGGFVYDYNKSVPTVCPNDSAHSIDTNSITIVESIKRNEVYTKDSNPGYFQAKSWKFEMAPGSSSHDISFPFDVNLIEGTFYGHASMVNDTISYVVGPDNIVGVITEDILIGGNSFTIAQPDIFNSGRLVKGLQILVNDLDMGYLINYDNDLQSMTVTNSANLLIPAGSPVKVEFVLIDNQYINYEGKYVYARKGFATNKVPADTIMRIYYENNGASPKDFVMNLQYYYY